MAFCSACGTPLPEVAAYCPRCGKAVNGTDVSGGPGGTSAAPYTTKTGTTGVPDNVAGMLCYTFVLAIIFLLVEPYSRNRFIRFHAYQSILFGLAWAVLQAVFGIPFVGWILWPTLQLAFLIGWIVLLIKAYQGVMFKLPVVGDFAEQHA